MDDSSSSPLHYLTHLPVGLGGKQKIKLVRGQTVMGIDITMCNWCHRGCIWGGGERGKELDMDAAGGAHGLGGHWCRVCPHLIPLRGSWKL